MDQQRFPVAFVTSLSPATDSAGSMHGIEKYEQTAPGFKSQPSTYWLGGLLSCLCLSFLIQEVGELRE